MYDFFRFREPWEYPDDPFRNGMVLFPRMLRVEEWLRRASAEAKWRVPAAWRLLRSGNPEPWEEW
jgi:hypothetical protein